MSDRENLPAKAASRSIAAPDVQRGSLVARGLAAIQSRTILAHAIEKDVLYRHARTVYDLMTDNGGTTWVGERIWRGQGCLLTPAMEDAFKALQRYDLFSDNDCTTWRSEHSGRGQGWLPISVLDEAFMAFQQLAREGYGKAYYPLSTLYSGEQSVKGDKSLAKHFAKLALDWCLANSFENDPEIWNDLGHLNLNEDYDQALQWFHKAALQNHPWGLFSMWSLCRSPNGYDEAEPGDLYWVTKAAEQGILQAIMHMIHVFEGDTDDHEPDDEQALYWYRKAAEQGFPWTEADFGADRFFELGNNYELRDWESDDVEKALEHYIAAAKLGHAEAQYCLSNILQVQNEDADSAEYWLKCASDLGFGPAQLDYAELVPEDEAQLLIDAAADWYKAQAESGIADWQYEYALLLLRDDDQWCSDPEEGLK